MKTKTIFASVLGLLWLLASPLAGQTGTAGAAGRPTCAVLADQTLDIRKSPLVSVIEQRLVEAGKLRLLDRNDVDKVLGEQQSQALFGADAGPRRTTAGKLLKADLLVLLRVVPAEKGEQRLEVVVSETGRGLRLRNRTVPLTNEPDADAAAVQEVIGQGVKKFGERVSEICAVPPFLSKDLAFEHDSLKQAFARLIEEALLDRPGVVVVELAEARAIAQEQALSGATGSVSRKPPLYFLGEYRDEGAGDRRTVSLGLAVMRGEARVGGVSKDGLAPADAPGFLREAAGRLLDEAGAAARTSPAAAVEARQLVARAREFETAGNWSEAVGLIEASLLLDPKQPLLHRDAAELLGKLANLAGAGPFNQDVEKARARNALLRRELAHAEAYLRAKRFSMSESWDIPAMQKAVGPDGVTPAPILLSEEVLKEEREMLLRVLQARIEEKSPDGYPGTLSRNFPWRVGDEPIKTMFDLMLQVIHQLEALPRVKELTRAIAYWAMYPRFAEFPECRAFLDQLKSSSNPEVRAGAAELEQMRTTLKEREAKRMEGIVGRPADAPPARPETGGDAGREVNFRPMKIGWEGVDGEVGVLTSVEGCLPIGDGTDVVWDARSVYLMKPGGARRVYSYDSYVHLEEACYDGRYVWAPARTAKEPPFLIVIDPAGEHVETITVKDGLPFASPDQLPENEAQFIAAAAVGPGKVCVAGSFGRTWVALVRFGPAGGKSVEVIHEARDQLPRRRTYLIDEEEVFWKSPTVTFRASSLAALTEPGDDGAGAARRIVAWRPYHPLLIDPGTKTVEVMPGKVSGSPVAPVLHRGAVYWAESGADSQVNLFRLGLPGPVKKPVLRDLPSGPLGIAFEGNRIHVIGQGWWEADIGGGPLRLVTARVPWSRPVPRAPGASAARGVNDKPGYFLLGADYGERVGLLFRTARLGAAGRVTFQASPPDRREPARAGPAGD